MKKLIPVCLSEDKYMTSEYISIYGYKFNYMYYIGYKIVINKSYIPDSDTSIAKEYNIPLKEYEKIVLKNNGYHDITFDDENVKIFNFVFNSKEDCQNAINDLLPWIIIKKIEGE